MERRICGASHSVFVRSRVVRRAGSDRALGACIFDNVCSCIRRSVWNAHPFRCDAYRAKMSNGRKKCCSPVIVSPTCQRLEVVHSHDRSARYELARTYVLHRRLYELFGLRTIPTLPGLARAVLSSWPCTCAARSVIGAASARRRPRRRARLCVARRTIFRRRCQPCEGGYAPAFEDRAMKILWLSTDSRRLRRAAPESTRIAHAQALCSRTWRRRPRPHARAGPVARRVRRPPRAARRRADRMDQQHVSEDARVRRDVPQRGDR